ncbi:TPA: hypothetical protein DEB00_03080 [Candidatus Uhrbacteria bacterium]|nr:hypothetical protein [Candidatus Uhrbacteria bacterium]
MKKIILIVITLFVVVVIVVLGLLSFYTQTKERSDADGVTQDEAQLEVESRTEVQKYMADLNKLGSKAQITAEDLGDEWNVHVYEIVINGDSSHTATFGWYRVNKKTGEVKTDM